MNELTSIEPIVGTIFFVLMLIMTVFVLLNILLSVVMDLFNGVCEERIVRRHVSKPRGRARRATFFQLLERARNDGRGLTGVHHTTGKSGRVVRS